MTEPSRKLLVIDDDAMVRMSLRAFLEEAGYNVHDEASGAAGIAWFKQHKPDLVLTDLRMPEMDGLTILQKVKEIDPELPVIVVSGLGMVDDVAAALRLGAADYLVKPVVDLDVLTHSIRRALEVLDLQRENARYRDQLEQANRELKDYVRVLERDQKAGHQVQSNLLPPSPVQYGNLTLSHRILPSLYLSGDFIDYGLINNRYVSFYLTDVSGHGASSAFVTVWLKQLVRRMIRERRIFQRGAEFEVDVSLWVEAINEELLHSKFGCHLTCFVGILDIQTRRIRYVLAGHLPLPVLVHNGQARFLEGKGKPVGIFDGATWTVYEDQLPEGASLVVFSDGILEILPPKDLIAKEQCLLDLLKHSSGQMQSVAEQLNLDGLQDAPDDIAVLTLNLGE